VYPILQIEFYNNFKGINEKSSEYTTPEGYFLNLRNYGFQRPGALTSRPGTEHFASFGFATFLAEPRLLANYEYFDFFGVGGSKLVFDSGNFLYSFTASPEVLFASLSSGATVSYPIDTTLAKNRLYLANGQIFAHIGLTSSTIFSVVKPGETVSPWETGANLTVFAGGVFGPTLAMPSGTYAATYAYARQIEGTSLFEVGERYAGPSFLFNNVGSTQLGPNFSYTIERIRPASPEWGISWIAVYLATPGATFDFVNIVPFSDAGTHWDVAAAFGGLAYRQNSSDPDNLPQFTLIPRFLEQYKNMLFVAGMSTQPSTVWFSEVGDQEHIGPENFFEIRTGNGEEITCLKEFQNTLIAFKYSSVHEINGDSPNTLSLKDMTLEYGCVNNQAAVVFDNKLWFVDKRGICEYNGPDTFIVSDAVQTTFAAQDLSKARAFHIKKRLEVWFCFGGTCLVYDYRLKSWTIYDGLPIEFAKASEILDFAGDEVDLSFVSPGTSFYNFTRFDDDLDTDLGQPITLLAQTFFVKRLGDTTQEMYRRFYLDAQTPSTSLAVTLNLKSDYGISNVYSTTFIISRFQTRKDFGVSARSLSVEWIIRSDSSVTINGYAIHARYLRSV